MPSSLPLKHYSRRKPSSRSNTDAVHLGGAYDVAVKKNTHNANFENKDFKMEISKILSSRPEEARGADLGVLQGRLVAGGLVVQPLRSLGVDVPQKQLLHQVIQVVMQVLLLHAEQLQLVHRKVKLPGAVVASLLAPQLVDHVGIPGALHGPSAAVVEPLAELFGHGGRVTHHLDPVQVVFCLRAAADDPGRLA